MASKAESDSHGVWAGFKLGLGFAAAAALVSGIGALVVRAYERAKKGDDDGNDSENHASSPE